MTPSVSRLYGVDYMLFDEYGAVSGKRTSELSNPAPVQSIWNFYMKHEELGL